MTVEIGPKVNELAEKVAEDALNTEDKAFRLDCLKVLSQFYIGMTRISGKMRGDEEDLFGLSLPEMRARIAEAGNVEVKEAPLVASARRRAAGESRVRDRNGRFE